MFKKTFKEIFFTIFTPLFVLIICCGTTINVNFVNGYNSNFNDSAQNEIMLEKKNINLSLSIISSSFETIENKGMIHDYLDNKLTNTSIGQIRDLLTNFSLSNNLILGTSLYPFDTNIQPLSNESIGSPIAFDEIMKVDYIKEYVNNADSNLKYFIRNEGISDYNYVKYDNKLGIFSLMKKINYDNTDKGLLICDFSTESIYQNLIRIQNYSYFNNSLIILKNENNYLYKTIDDKIPTIYEYDNSSLSPAKDNYFRSNLEIQENINLLINVPVWNQKRKGYEVTFFTIGLEILLSIIVFFLAYGLAKSITKPLNDLNNKMINSLKQ